MYLVLCLKFFINFKKINMYYYIGFWEEYFIVKYIYERKSKWESKEKRKKKKVGIS